MLLKSSSSVRRLRNPSALEQFAWVLPDVNPDLTLCIAPDLLRNLGDCNRKTVQPCQGWCAYSDDLQNLARSSYYDGTTCQGVPSCAFSEPLGTEVVVDRLEIQTMLGFS